MASSWEASKKQWWKGTTRRQGNGSGERRRIARSISRTRHFRIRKRSRILAASTFQYALREPAQIPSREKQYSRGNERGQHGSRNENPGAHDGPRHQYADRRPEGR